MDFTGRRIMISGASGDIGTATSKELKNLGAEQVLVSLENGSLVQSHERNKGVDRVFLTEYSKSEIKNKIGHYLIANPNVDSLVCLNGMLKLSPGLREPDLVIDKIWDANFWIPLEIIRTFVSSASASPERKMKIIVLSSVSATRSQPGLAAYGASKAALESYVKTLSLEFRAKNVLFSIYRSGLLDSKMSENIERAVGDTHYKSIVSSYPLGLGSPENVARHLIQGLSEYSGWVTGNIVNVEGGYLN